MTHWINTVSRDHVRRGVAGGFTQANHGKQDALKRLSQGDWIAFYSPKTDYPQGDRRKVEFLDCTETPIRPLIDRLDFIEDKKRWGFRFRFGLFRIGEPDFEVIRAALTGTVAQDGSAVA
jgi:hypothetical protein